MKNSIFKIFAICSFLLITSCYSYRVFPKEYRKLIVENQNIQKAYVLNKDLKKEYEILKKSGVFQIVDDSTNHLKIKLYPLKQVNKADGQGFVISFLTLGQVPINFYDTYNMGFDEIRDEKVEIRSFDLFVAQRVWFWDIFKFKKDFEKNAAKALNGSYLNKKTEKSSLE